MPLCSGVAFPSFRENSALWIRAATTDPFRRKYDTSRRCRTSGSLTESQLVMTHIIAKSRFEALYVHDDLTGNWLAWLAPSPQLSVAKRMSEVVAPRAPDTPSVDVSVGMLRAAAVRATRSATASAQATIAGALTLLLT